MHKYVQVYFNHADLKKNTFAEIKDCKRLITKLESKLLPAGQGELSPVIFVNRKLYSMMNPTVYYALLKID